MTRTPPSSVRAPRRGRPCATPREPNRTRILSDTDAGASTPDAEDTDEPLPAAEYHAGSLADDVADDDNLGLFAAVLSPLNEGWTTENPKPRMPGPLKTNVTRYASQTKQTFALALCCFYDESTLYALR
ncbi:unnamed protein product [Penicillium nalgiovense]|nr:unnamed protein product [Penicillium nalgiovense]